VEREGGEPSARGDIPRRRILQAGAIGIGGLLGGGLVFNLADAQRGPSTPSATPTNPEREGLTIERPQYFREEPSWVQEFNLMRTTAIDTAVWRHELSPDVPSFNGERQAYTSRPENVRIEPGLGLVIEAHRRQYQYPDDPEGRQFDYTSGRIDTKNSFSFEYGKLEARLRMPKGRGVWPAFWLLSANEIHTAGRSFTREEVRDERFYLRNGEVDIMEYYGRNPGEVEATVHTFTGSHAAHVDVEDATDAFHAYAVELTPTSIVWTVDGWPYHRYTKPSNDTLDWPFGNGNRLRVILNLAMGGPLAGPIRDRQAPWRFEVENLRYYEYTG
jgi:beta-glucanase (GH16 family)